MLPKKLTGWLRRTSPMICLSLLAGVIVYAAPQAGGYKIIKRMQIGGDGGWDYMTVDSAGQRLYVSHATEVVVIDLANDTIAGHVTDTPGVHGIAVVPELGKGFTSNGRAPSKSFCSILLSAASRWDGAWAAGPICVPLSGACVPGGR